MSPAAVAAPRRLCTTAVIFTSRRLLKASSRPQLNSGTHLQPANAGGDQFSSWVTATDLPMSFLLRAYPSMGPRRHTPCAAWVRACAICWKPCVLRYRLDRKDPCRPFGSVGAEHVGRRQAQPIGYQSIVCGVRLVNCRLPGPARFQRDVPRLTPAPRIERAIEAISGPQKLHCG